MKIRKERIGPLLLVLLLSVTDACTSGGDENRNLSQWVDHLIAERDSRSEFDKWAGRANDAKSTADALIKIRDALGGKVDADDLLMFVPRYDAIWNGNVYQAGRAEVLASRMKLLSDDDFESWGAALEMVHGDGVSREWTAGFIAEIDSLFPDSRFDSARSQLLLDRLRALPETGIGEFATALNKGKAAAAVKIIQQDWLFAGAGNFRNQLFVEATTTLKNRLPGAT